MSFFEDDPFEDIVNQFFGNHARVRRRPRSRITEDEGQNTQFIEEETYIYFIMELPGYSEKDINLSIKDNVLIISAKTSQKSDAQDYLAQKLKEGIIIQQQVPKDVGTKSLSKTFRNGVLEVTFIKR